MSVKLFSKDPEGLLKAIKAAIDDGKVDSWSYDRDGDFTHNGDQWKYRAWLRPSVTESHLLFALVPRSDEQVTVEDYAVYHGRFIEMVLSYVDGQFTSGSVSAMPADGDDVGSRGE